MPLVVVFGGYRGSRGIAGGVLRGFGQWLPGVDRSTAGGILCIPESPTVEILAAHFGYPGLVYPALVTRRSDIHDTRVLTAWYVVVGPLCCSRCIQVRLRVLRRAREYTKIKVREFIGKFGFESRIEETIFIGDFLTLSNIIFR